MNLTAVLILSGGMDSGTLLYDLLHYGWDVRALSFDYAQRHRRELLCARALCEKLEVPHEIIPFRFFRNLANNSCLTGESPVPEGNYGDANMRRTVVPNRNMVLISVAASYALNIGAQALYYGAHSGDHTIYPDCRPEFVEAMQYAISLCDWNPLYLSAPYLHMTKTDILRRGLELGVDYSLTWTCYNGREKSCGKCGACTERLEAFRNIGIKDPREYE